jgi:hypothetical protein
VLHGQFKTLFGVLISLGLVSCRGNGPLVDVCISFPVRQGFICVNKEDQTYFLPYSNSLKYVAFSPADAQLLIESCGVNGRTKAYIREYVGGAVDIAEAAVGGSE